MRRGSWKGKVLVVIAFIIGIVSGGAVAASFPEKYELYRGLASFGTMAAVAVVTVFVGVKIFRIGEE